MKISLRVLCLIPCLALFGCVSIPVSSGGGKLPADALAQFERGFTGNGPYQLFTVQTTVDGKAASYSVTPYAVEKVTTPFPGECRNFGEYRNVGGIGSSHAGRACRYGVAPALSPWTITYNN